MVDVLSHVEELLKIDWEAAVSEITRFVRSYFESSGASGVVLGLSGGVDSSTTLGMLVKALGPEKILGLVMPTSFTPERDVADALETARSFGVRTKVVTIDNIVKSYVEASGISGDEGAKLAMANLRARVRMTILYLHANAGNMLVAGTSDKSEILIGYYTKYGDGASDFLVISNLYKTQVRRLCELLGISRSICYKPSSPQLYPGHRAVDELPADYDLIDQILYLYFDKGLRARDIVRMLGTDPGIVSSVLKRHLWTEHKRKLPPGPGGQIYKRSLDEIAREVSDLFSIS